MNKRIGAFHERDVLSRMDSICFQFGRDSFQDFCKENSIHRDPSNPLNPFEAHYILGEYLKWLYPDKDEIRPVKVGVIDAQQPLLEAAAS